MQSSIHFRCHSSSSPGLTKNSISMISNSRVRKMKLPVVISLRKVLPIWAMPNGSLRRVVLRTLSKLTKMPWAVSGRRWTLFSSDWTGPTWVSNMRLNCRASVKVPVSPQFGTGVALKVVGAEALAAAAAVDEGVGEVFDVAAGAPDLGVHEDGGVEADHVAASPYEGLPPVALDVVLELDAEGAVVPGAGESAVDLAALEEEASAAA